MIDRLNITRGVNKKPLATDEGIVGVGKVVKHHRAFICDVAVSIEPVLPLIGYHLVTVHSGNPTVSIFFIAFCF